MSTFSAFFASAWGAVSAFITAPWVGISVLSFMLPLFAFVLVVIFLRHF